MHAFDFGYNFRGFSDLLSETHLCTHNAVSYITHSENLISVLCALGMQKKKNTDLVF